MIFLGFEKIRLQFYTKSGCSLCEVAKADLKKLHLNLIIEIEEIDITSDTKFFEKYKYLIPVGELDGIRLFTHRINTKALIRRLKKMGRLHWIGYLDTLKQEIHDKLNDIVSAYIYMV